MAEKVNWNKKILNELRIENFKDSYSFDLSKATDEYDRILELLEEASADSNKNDLHYDIFIETVNDLIERFDKKGSEKFLRKLIALFEEYQNKDKSESKTKGMQTSINYDLLADKITDQLMKRLSEMGSFSVSSDSASKMPPAKPKKLLD